MKRYFLKKHKTSIWGVYFKFFQVQHRGHGKGAGIGTLPVTGDHNAGADVPGHAPGDLSWTVFIHLHARGK